MKPQTETVLPRQLRGKLWIQYCLGSLLYYGLLGSGALAISAGHSGLTRLIYLTVAGAISTIAWLVVCKHMRQQTAWAQTAINHLQSRGYIVTCGTPVVHGQKFTVRATRPGQDDGFRIT